MKGLGIVMTDCFYLLSLDYIFQKLYNFLRALRNFLRALQLLIIFSEIAF